MTDHEPELGIDVCVGCQSPLVKEQIGYCESCLQQQMNDHELEEYLDPGSPDYLRKYADRKRRRIERFLNKKNIRPITLFEVLGIFRKKTKAKIHAIISPELAAIVDYSLIRRVSRIQPVTQDKKSWLTDYWYKKYELELKEFDFIVGLVFEGENHYGYYYNVYDYPSSLVSTFAVDESQEEGSI